MTETVNIVIVFTVAMVLAVGALVAAFLLGPWRGDRVKREPYECGIEVESPARVRISVRFFVLAVVFMVFDVEVLFVYPWAMIVREAGMYGLITMGYFMFVLVIGLIYAWRQGALDFKE